MSPSMAKELDVSLSFRVFCPNPWFRMMTALVLLFTKMAGLKQMEFPRTAEVFNS